MDTLVALGSATAFGYSVWGLFSGWHGHLYFMEAASIITLISAGHYVEAIVSARAAGSLRALMNLAPQTARKVDQAGNELEVPVATLRPGDPVVSKPGDRVHAAAAREPDGGLDADDAVHAGRADDAAVGLAADADRGEVRGRRGAATRARAACVAVKGVRVIALAATSRPAARGEERSEIRPLAEGRLAEDDGTGGAKIGRDRGVVSRGRADQTERAGRGLHLVAGVDVVLE